MDDYLAGRDTLVTGCWPTARTIPPRAARRPHPGPPAWMLWPPAEAAGAYGMPLLRSDAFAYYAPGVAGATRPA